jgi:hypothetical protein
VAVTWPGGDSIWQGKTRESCAPRIDRGAPLPQAGRGGRKALPVGVFFCKLSARKKLPSADRVIRPVEALRRIPASSATGLPQRRVAAPATRM